MNKKDIAALAEMLVRWEFRQGGSSSEAATLTRCIEELREAFHITDEQLSVDRAFMICRLAGDESDEFFDAVCDLVDADYQGLVDKIDEDGGFDVVKTLVYGGREACTPLAAGTP